MKLDSEQKRVLKAGLPASLGAVLGTIVGMLAQGNLDSWNEALIGIGVGLLFALLFCVFYVLGSKIPKKNDDSAKE
jgi:drug/metabolite transporter (DMT)-like permease